MTPTNRSLAFIAIVLGLVMGSAPAARQPVAGTLSMEQIAYILLDYCPDGYGYYSLCAAGSVLADPDGTSTMDMPHGEWSPDGRIRLEHIDGDIHSRSATGGTRVNLTNHPASDLGPRWSRDGARIAFVSDRDGSPDLYVMNADGTNVARIATGVQVVESRPTWSADNTRLAFTCVNSLLEPENIDICTVNIDGSGLARLTNDAGRQSEPDWSPDGTRIIFSTYTSNSVYLATMNPAGGDVTIVTPGMQGESARWSPDGTRIAFVQVLESAWDDPEIYGAVPSHFVSVMNADGTGVTSFGWSLGPTWRPVAAGVNYRPTASLTFDCDGLTCTLDASGSTDSDGGVAEYGWQFDDGTIGTGTTITHTFSSAYRAAILRVMDEDGALASTGWVLVNHPPVVAFTTSCAGRTCTFDGSSSTDQDGDAMTFDWSFGDGQSARTSIVSHTFPAPGTYSVVLGVSDEGGSRSFREAQVIIGTDNTPPVATFWYSCSVLDCHFNGGQSSDPDGDVLTYTWTLGDGAVRSSVIANHTYAAPGTYPVVLTVRDPDGATATHTINVYLPPPAFGYLHVGDLTGTSTRQPKTWTANARILVHSDTHNAVGNAVVSGRWNSGYSGSCITGPTGTCDISQATIPRTTVSETFTVMSIARDGYLYAGTKNHDPNGDSTGTVVKIIR